MVFSCPECDATHDVEPRYCTECGAEVNLDADMGAASAQRSFWKRHENKIVVLAAVITALYILPSAAAGASAGALMGGAAGTFVAALVLSYVMVYVAVAVTGGASGKASG